MARMKCKSRMPRHSCDGLVRRARGLRRGLAAAWPRLRTLGLDDAVEVNKQLDRTRPRRRAQHLELKTAAKGTVCSKRNDLVVVSVPSLVRREVSLQSRRWSRRCPTQTVR